MKKKKLFIMILIMAVIVFLFLLGKYPFIFADVFYPKVEFNVWAEKKANTGHDPNLRIEIWRARYSAFTQNAVIWIAAGKPYKELRIKRLQYAWENNSGVYCKNLFFKISWEDEVDGWYYDFRGGFPGINLRKIFHDKKPGDEFELQWIITYQFDDEPERTDVLKCTVVAVEGTLRIPIPVFVGM